jgi:hypothetical protein
MKKNNLATKFLSHIKHKRLGHIELATRTETLNQPLFANHFLVTTFQLFIIFGSIGLILFGVGPMIYKFLQISSLTTTATVFLELESFYIFIFIWIFPSIFLGITLVQILLVIFPKIGNSITAPDIIQVLSITNPEIKKQLKGKKFVAHEMQEILKHIDLRFLARFTMKRLAITATIITLVLSPFLYLASQNYLTVNDQEKIIYSPYWSLKKQTIEPHDIDRVRVGVRPDDGHLDPYFDLELKNGVTMDLWEMAYGGTDPEQLILFSEFLIDKDVTFFVSVPSNLDPIRPSVQEKIHEVIDAIQELKTEHTLRNLNL